MSVLYSRPSSFLEDEGPSFAAPPTAAECERHMETLKKAWAWTKANWQWLLFPIGIVLFIAGRFSKPAEVVTVDPTAKADDRAKEEESIREHELATEREALKTRLAEVHKENQAKLRTLTETQLQHAALLESDPEALNTWLRAQ